MIKVVRTKLLIEYIIAVQNYIRSNPDFKSYSKFGDNGK